jgi:hypothetical protein
VGLWREQDVGVQEERELVLRPYFAHLPDGIKVTAAVA